jgi:hypothetical protein
MGEATTGREAEVAGEVVIEGEAAGEEDYTPGHTPEVEVEDTSLTASRTHQRGSDKTDQAEQEGRSRKVDRDATVVAALPIYRESAPSANAGTVAGKDTNSGYVPGPE